MLATARVDDTNKVEQMIIATVGFFWCFLMWFATAAFSPSIQEAFNLSTAELGLLASSAIWLAPVGRLIAGWASDQFGAPNVFLIILVYSGVTSIASAFVSSYGLLFVTRLIVASAGISFVVGIQHVAQWFDSHEMGVAQGIYAGTGNAGAGVGALLLPRIYGTDYQSAFLHLGIVALVIAAWYFLRGVPAKSEEAVEQAREKANWSETLKVWTKGIALALMLAYAMSFGLEIAFNGWLPGYYAEGFKGALKNLGFESLVEIQTAAGTFAAVHSFNASLFRPFAGYMSDLWQRNEWTPLPYLVSSHEQSPRIHWLMLSLILITLFMGLMTLSGVLGILPVSVVILMLTGICVSFATGGVFGLVPCLFPKRPGIATGFIGGVSCTGGIIYPLVFGYASSIHMGYAYVGLFMFVPFLAVFAYVFRESAPSLSGTGTEPATDGAEGSMGSADADGDMADPVQTS